MAESPRPQAARVLSRRGRISHACVPCQQRKQKCDGGSPSCRNCTRNKRACVIQDPATKRSIPRGYVESLENHVALLEETIRKLQPNYDAEDMVTDQAPLMVPDQRDTTQQVLREDIPGPDHEHDFNIFEVHNNDAIGSVDEKGSPFANESQSSLDLLWSRAAGGEPHYFGSSSALSFAKMFSATLRAVRTQGPGLTMSGMSNIIPESHAPAEPIPLPESATVRLLTSAYFEQVHPQFPFMHRPTYRRWEEEVIDTLKKGEIPDPTHLFFVYAISAVGVLTAPCTDNRLAEGMYSSAEYLFEHVIKFNSLKSIQAILCCAMYSIRSPIGVSTWILSGLALRQSVEMGLHRKIIWIKIDQDVLKKQMRQRIFWCCYNLDRAVAITLGRPVGINDCDIDVEYPLDIDDDYITVYGITGTPRTSTDAPATTVSSAIHTIRIRQIWGRMQALMFPQAELEFAPSMTKMLEDSFKSELKKWFSEAPEQLPTNRKRNNTFGSVEWFELMYHHSILILFHHKLVKVTSSKETEENDEVFLDCARSAERICQIYRSLYSNNRLNDTWGALHVLFLGGITFLYCLWMNTKVQSLFRLDRVASTCTSCVMIFAVMSERWKAAEPFRECFDTLASLTQAMLVESIANAPTRGMPISLTSNGQLPEYLTSISELGMCSSVEALLSGMIE